MFRGEHSCSDYDRQPKRRGMSSDMKAAHTIFGLTAKHAALSGEIAAAKKRVNALIRDLKAVERTLKLFDPDAKTGPAKRFPPHRKGPRGAMRRDVLVALREATAPITSQQIAEHVLRVRTLPASEYPRTRRGVTCCLWRLREAGLVQEVPLLGDYKGWKLP